MRRIDSKDLQRIYIAYFCRPGDPSGISYWLSNLNQSLTLEEISFKLSQQDEYKIYSSNYTSIDSQINQLYINLFARNADSETLNYWLNYIQEKKYTISDILYNILLNLDQPELLDSKQFQRDFKVLQNKVSAAESFTEYIRKSITFINWYQPDSLSPWISGEALKKASDFISNININSVSDEEINCLLASLINNSTPILTDTAIAMKNISLYIPIYYPENRSLTKRFTNKVINLTGGKLSKSKKGTSVIALNNINLRILKGERVALIGHNGSGKSSFLRLISGIYQPTSGEINMSINVYPMLQKTFLTSSELNGIDACKAHYLLTNNNLNGFENFLNDIIEFSGLGSYISLPIKTYSDGMAARLIFSILTSSPHDCFAIDEGFGTGDADFFEKAEARMKKFMDSAATLFLASHSEELLKQFCNRGIVFSHGSIVYDGSLEAALNYYHTHDYYIKNVIR